MSSFISFSQSFFETLLTWIIPNLFKIFLIVFIACVIRHLTKIATGNFIRQSRFIKRAETLRQVIDSTSKVLIIAIALMMILNELGLDTRPIIASAGILGVAFSLGAQHLMKDVISGFFILLEGQFGVGDVIKAGDITGSVEKMTLRVTTLKDANGNVHVIPNGEIKQVSVLKC